MSQKAIKAVGSNKSLNDKIDSWVSSLVGRIIEIRYVDIEEMKTSLKVHFKMAMMDSLKMQITNTERERKENIKKLKIAKGTTLVKIQQDLTEINFRLKSENKLNALLDRDREAKEMALWMREKHTNSLLSFYKMYNEKFH